MKKYILIFLLFFTLQYCKNKEENRENMSSTQHFSMATNLNNLKNLKTIKLNDSINKITGFFNSYEIQGYIKNSKEKIGWWKITEFKNKNLVTKLEYKSIDRKEFANQYIIFSKEKIDTLNSKFYSKNINNDFVEYKFYVPGKFKKLKSEGKLNYHLYVNGAEKNHTQSKGIRNNNVFTCEVKIPSVEKNDNIIVRGNFWEMFQVENGDIGENEIYVLDTLR